MTMSECWMQIYLPATDSPSPSTAVTFTQPCVSLPTYMEQESSKKLATQLLHS